MHTTCCFLLMNTSHCVSSHVLESLEKVGKNPRKGKTKPNQIKPKEKIITICISMERCVAFLDHSEGLSEASPTTCRATGAIEDVITSHLQLDQVHMRELALTGSLGGVHYD